MPHRASVGRGAGSFGVRPRVVVVLLVTLAVPPAAWAAPTDATLRAGQAGQTGQAAKIRGGLEEIPIPHEIAGHPDAEETYRTIAAVLQEALGYSAAETEVLVRQQARAHGTSMVEELRGVLDATELPTDEAFDTILREADTLIISGGNGGRMIREVSRWLNEHDEPHHRKGRAVSVAPVDDSEGNYAKWQALLKDLFQGFVVSLSGDVANVRTAEALPVTRQLAADRTRERPGSGWGREWTLNGLLREEMVTALKSFQARFPGRDPSREPILIRSMATLLGAGRILERTIPDLMTTSAMDSASGQNVLGVAIAARSGFLDFESRPRQVHPERLRQAALLWNRALSLDGHFGVVLPTSLDEGHVYFVYEDPLPAAKGFDEQGRPVMRFGDAAVRRGDFFTVTLDGDRLVLTDGDGHRLIQDPALEDPTQQRYVARVAGVEVNRFEAFPRRIRQAIRTRLTQKQAKGQELALSLVRGEGAVSEEDSWYENTRVLAWGMEFPAASPLQTTPVLAEYYRRIVAGQTAVRTIVLGAGSEGSSIATHFWRRETVQFLVDLADRRRDGQSDVPRVVFLFNPSETNDAYKLDPLGIIEHYELIFREVLDNDTIRFENLIPEVVFFAHDDPWILARNPVAIEEFKRLDPAAAEKHDLGDYLRILEPASPAKHYGLVRRHRRRLTVDAEALAKQRQFQKVYVGPYGDVRVTVESSRGTIKPKLDVQALTHRIAAVLYPEAEARAILLPAAVQKEYDLYLEKHGEENPPTADALAEFLNRVGYQTTTAQVRTILTAKGLKEGGTVQHSGLEEIGAETVTTLVREIRNFVATADVPPEFQPGMGLVVDLATGSESDALAALLLPPGSVVVLTTEALLKAEQLAARTAIEQGITTVTVDSQDGVSAALRVAVARARDGAGKTVRVYSGADSGELRQIVNDVADGRVEFNGGLTVEQIFQSLGLNGQFVSEFLGFSGRAQKAWKALSAYL